ncbi:MAG: hypothetical protein ACX93T_02285 [Bacteroidota bacterium]
MSSRLQDFSSLRSTLLPTPDTPLAAVALMHLLSQANKFASFGQLRTAITLKIAKESPLLEW